MWNEKIRFYNFNKLTGLMNGADKIEAAVAAIKPGSPVSPVIVV